MPEELKARKIEKADFVAWYEAMGFASKAECGEFLGIAEQSVYNYLNGDLGPRGYPPMLGLAMAAAWHRLPPYRARSG